MRTASAVQLGPSMKYKASPGRMNGGFEILLLLLGKADVEDEK